MDVQTQVITIIADLALLDAKDVSPEATLEELGVDSLAMVEIIYAIEQVFDVSVPFNANDPAASGFDISSVASIVAAVEALVQERGLVRG